MCMETPQRPRIGAKRCIGGRVMSLRCGRRERGGGDGVYAEIDRSTRALSMAAAATDGAAAWERGCGAAGGRGLHIGTQGHLYRA